MDTKELLKKVRKVEIKTRKLSDHIFGGEYHSTFKGRGMTFSEVRPYQFGDDIRTIDWNVTARYNEPYVKVFEEERELTLMLMVDVSGSELFGTVQEFKSEIITEIAATLAFSALQNNDKTGLILFSDEIELFIPPKKGKSHVLRIIRELIEFEPKSRQTSLSGALEFLSRVMKKKAIVFLLSDFMDKGYEKPLQIAAKKHDVTGIRIYDAKEMHLPKLGYIMVKDAESGELIQVNTSSSAVRADYERQYREGVAYFENLLQKSGAGVVSCRSDESYTQKLLGYFKRR
ncbi:Protein of unknown function DUF58 [Capnocytophaga haemolytica]|jgi:hypothetical protein|uniref:Uncharacterized conserved protein (Some members contain a von Willebrand factor type A (VWA) domain) n=1 Tax=Capnocytophaga haemolytica TaxID=45243 RepID=A0AAX2GYY2_9FLAO|nr:DUF58 domain-containing protein [Capnocytophaga haemolytica]SFN61632.1 Protein of unknown function DUF58 [Capnocytophaga haemolytica]SNV03448.1 Uncharacterized conserved protein (some members contain a von Willebrand factor type A (vWA) domain) [Capnocytophaga haemolytica]